MHLALVALMMLPVSAWAGGPYARTQAWALAEPVPVKQYAEDWQGPLQRGSDGLALIEAETGWQADGWVAGWVWQRQYVIRASRDTAVLYHLSKNDAPAPANREFHLNLHANTYEARGLRLGRVLSDEPISGWHLEWTPSLVIWRGDLHEDGRLTGTATSNASGALSYNADLAHFYSEDPLLDRRIERPDGRGASLDLSARLSIREQWVLDLQVRNLLARMWWSQAPYTLGELRSDTRQTDSQGNVNFRPSLSGFEGQESHRQRLPLHAQVRARRALGHWGGAHHAELGLTQTELERYWDVGWGMTRGEWQAGLRYIPQASHALGLRLGWRQLQLDWAADHWRWERAHHVQLNLSLAWQLP